MARTRRTFVYADCKVYVEPGTYGENDDREPLDSSLRQQHALYGVSQELDLRPLLFVEPPPQARVCSACGLVLAEAGLLPCGHVLCRPCYEQRPQNAGCICPLDLEVCPNENVDWKEFGVESLMRRQVKCWNEAHGCRAVVTLSEICSHFRQDCRHHFTRCPKCSASVLRSNLSVHLVSQCSVMGENCSNELEGSVAERLERVEESLRDVKAALQGTANASLAAEPSAEQREIGHALTADVSLARDHEGERTALGVRSAGQEDSSVGVSEAGLSELQQSIDTIKETSSHEFRQLNAEVLHSLDTQLKEQTTELTELLEDRVGRIRAELGRLFIENNIRNSEHLQSLNAFREIVKQELEEMSKVQNSMLNKHSQSVSALRESVEKQLREMGRRDEKSAADIAAADMQRLLLLQASRESDDDD